MGVPSTYGFSRLKRLRMKKNKGKLRSLDILKMLKSGPSVSSTSRTTTILEVFSSPLKLSLKRDPSSIGQVSGVVEQMTPKLSNLETSPRLLPVLVWWG